MITLTERQAVICERALDMLAMGSWPEFENEIERYTETPLTDEEIAELENVLRG